MLKEELLKLGVFEDNDYLDIYCKLIEDNRNTVKEQGKTNYHHIIPRSYFKVRFIEVDESESNLVHLLYADHFKAHCLLYLASNNDTFRVYSYSAIRSLLSMSMKRGNIERDYLETLPEYKEVLIKHDSIELKETFSTTHKEHLSQAMKGNHNCINPDTRSVKCHCILNDGRVFNFPNYLVAGKWWYKEFHPFGEAPYAECTFQRKIKKSIKGEDIVYNLGHHGAIYVTGIKWYKDNVEMGEYISKEMVE